MTPISLFPDWMSGITLQQQAVLVMALRGQDGDQKNTMWKELLRAYRGSVIKAAHFGRMLEMGEVAGSYMRLDLFSDFNAWKGAVEKFCEDEADSAVLHAYTHFMHGCEVLAYKHPNYEFRIRWFYVYETMAERLHLPVETASGMTRRLSDYSRWTWDPLVQPPPGSDR